MTALLKQKITVHYPDYFQAPARADVSIYETEDKTIVLVSQPKGDYSGLSVTNGIERIVTEVYHSLNIEAYLPYVLIVEHYPAENLFARKYLGKPSFDLVTFAWVRTQLTPYLPYRFSATSPKWEHLGQDGWLELTGIDPEAV